MGPGHRVSCVLCQRSEETKVTGALSTKEDVTAHQNCLLFSSGIYCRNSPQFDDLFGFSVDDVLDEVKRGSKLMCNKCKTKGATAGCEIKRCKKSYHYPCAVQEGAKTVEDEVNGKYGVYCENHYQKIQEKNGAVNGHASSTTKARTSKNPSGAGPSKVYCLACEKTGGIISLESLSNSIIMLYCEKHAPSSLKRNTSDDSTAAGPSGCSSDSNTSSTARHSLSKRRLSFNDREEDVPSKRECHSWKLRISDSSSNSEEKEVNSDMEIFAPIEFDLDESANSVPESQLIRKETESPAGSPPGNPLEDETLDENKDDDETIIVSDAESESLLLPVEFCIQSQSQSQSVELNFPAASAAEPSVEAEEVAKTDGEGSNPEQSPVHSPGQHTTGPPPSPPPPPPPSPSPSPSLPPPDHSKPRSVTGSPPCTSSAVAPAPPETICVSLLLDSPSPSSAAHISKPEPGIDSTRFWKSCNAAGCTRAIFTDFITEMNDISSRIQSDQASQEDYDLALTVMAASGKLAELVTKQQKELQRKQTELQKAAEAMKDVVSALKR